MIIEVEDKEWIQKNKLKTVINFTCKCTLQIFHKKILDNEKMLGYENGWAPTAEDPPIKFIN